MKFYAGLLKQIIKGKSFNLQDDYRFSFLDIAKPTGELALSIDYSKPLYFALFEKNDNGWYNSDIDKKSKVNLFVENNPNGAILTEDADICLKYSSHFRTIYVDNISESIIDLFNFALKFSNPKIISLTGSVGKTTAIALIEDIIATEKQVLRLYSKRITPLNLYSMVINFLEEYHEYIAFEASLNRFSHVGELASILLPDFASILNIGDAHLGMEDIRTHQDIFNSKVRLFQKNTLPFVNLDDNVTRRNLASINRPYITFGIDKANDPVYSVDFRENNVSILKDGASILSCAPFLLTRLSVSQILACSAIASHIGIRGENIERAVSSFVPKENRIKAFDYMNKKIIFDGDVTLSSRLKELSNNYYFDPALVISNIFTSSDSADAINFQKGQIESEVFPKFKKVFVADNCDHHGILKGINYNCQYFSPENFSKIINSWTGDMILHHAVFFRDDSPFQKMGAYCEISIFLRSLEGLR